MQNRSQLAYKQRIQPSTKLGLSSGHFPRLTTSNGDIRPKLDSFVVAVWTIRFGKCWCHHSIWLFDSCVALSCSFDTYIVVLCDNYVDCSSTSQQPGLVFWHWDYRWLDNWWYTVHFTWSLSTEQNRLLSALHSPQTYVLHPGNLQTRVTSNICIVRKVSRPPQRSFLVHKDVGQLDWSIQ